MDKNWTDAPVPQDWSQGFQDGLAEALSIIQKVDKWEDFYPALRDLEAAYGRMAFAARVK